MEILKNYFPKPYDTKLVRMDYLIFSMFNKVIRFVIHLNAVFYLGLLKNPYGLRKVFIIIKNVKREMENAV
jgi:hypothetical protein